MALKVQQVVGQGMSEVAQPYRRLIPDKEGKSIDEQILPWSVTGLKNNFQQPSEIHQSEPTTMSNIINMMAVELQHWADYTAYANWVQNKDLKNLLTKLARAEDVHHMKLLSLLPKPHDPSEGVLDMEVALLSTYGICMDRETNDVIRDAFFHMFQDHLTHAEYAAGLVRDKGCDPNMITGGADISGGRVINQQFMKAESTVWHGHYGGSYDKNNVDPLTLINVDMCIAAETAAWGHYSCAMMNTDDPKERLNYAVFQSIESQHAVVAGSLKDPSETPMERMLVHEAVEISNYGMMMNHESDAKVRKVFQDIYVEDVEHARLLGGFVL